MTMCGRVPVEIVNRIAAHEDVDPLEIEPKLYDVVDTDALVALVEGTEGRPNRERLRVNFRYCGYVVTVMGSGEITLEQTDVDGGTGAAEDRGTAD